MIMSFRDKGGVFPIISDQTSHDTVAEMMKKQEIDRIWIPTFGVKHSYWNWTDGSGEIFYHY